jgi:hypothetical protein
MSEGTVLPETVLPEIMLPGTVHGIRMSGRGQQLVLWCACQRADTQRARWHGEPVEVRARWTVPEALVALALAGHPVTGR